MARARRVLLWAGGSLVAIGVLVVAAGLWWVGSLYQSEESDAERAALVFAEVRARFAGSPPVFKLRDDRLVVARTVTSPSSPAAATHMLVWTPSDRTLSRLRLPFAISVVATEPLPLEALAGVANQGLGAVMSARRRGNETSIRIADLERYGRTLLLDGNTGDGRWVLMWNE
jgi:hypothetical protein